MVHRHGAITAAKAVVVSGLMTIAAGGQALAHVKWFCAFDVAGQPRGLENVLCLDFEQLVGLALIILVAACALEGTRLGAALTQALRRFLEPIRLNTEFLIRVVCGAFFVALWTQGGILLTPELKTTWVAVPWFQLAIAVGLMSRQTLIFSAIGIGVLFDLSIWQYGSFHLMDYPVFLGLAAYLALVWLERPLAGLKPLDVLRWTAAVTLMWASIEKWAYPEWSFPLFVLHPEMTMGFDSEFFMRAAGVVEFGLSFALIWTPLCRRVAALILTGIFVSAIFEFGKIDAIGHAPIIVAMMVIAADEAPGFVERRPALWLPVAFTGALSVFLLGYYLVHAAMFGTTIA